MPEVKEGDAKITEEKAQAEADEKAAAEKNEDKKENMIPQTRFNEVNDRAKAAEAKVTAMEAAEAKAEEARLIEKENYKELAEKRGAEVDKFKAEAEKAVGMEATLTELLEASMEAIPKDLRSLVPESLSTQEKLAYIATNAAVLTKADPMNVGAGERGGNKEKGKIVVLTEDQKTAARNAGVTDEAYAKFI